MEPCMRCGKQDVTASGISTYPHPYVVRVMEEKEDGWCRKVLMCQECLVEVLETVLHGYRK